MPSGYALTSGRAMRRQSGVPLPSYGALVFSVSNPSTVRLADVVGAPPLPPPAVPVPDAGPHADAAVGAGAGALRRVVLPLNVTADAPVLTYEGRDVVVVRL